MLRSAEELRGYRLHGIDDDLGKVEDLYFDDFEWRVRYFVVKTGGWLSGKQVLLSPIALTGAPERDRTMRLSLTTDQVRKSPDIDLAKPVSRQNEVDLHAHYGWVYYAFGDGMGGLRPEGTEPGATGGGMETQLHDPTLRSVKEVTGYRIQTRNGDLGHVEDFIVDDTTWDLRYLVIDTAPLWLGKKVLVSPHWIQGVEWADGLVKVALSQEEIEEAPEWDGSFPIDTGYDERLHAYYRGSVATAARRR